MPSDEQHWTSRISAVFVTFNSARVIRQALQSLPRGVEAIVVDNASEDESVSVALAEGARCIRNSENLGFGTASNLGAAECDREFILFLNPDAALTGDALKLMMETAIRYPAAGAVGPKLIAPGGRTIWRFASVLHPVPGGAFVPPDEPVAACCMPLLTGAALLCRREAFEAIGGFDRNIFLYHEDDDLSLRLTRAGWSLIYEPGARVFHAFGRSSAHSPSIARFKAEQHMLSRAYVFRKYGMRFDPGYEHRKSIKRLLIALATFDFNRRAAAFGRLDALRHLKAEGGANGARQWKLPAARETAPRFAGSAFAGRKPDDTTSDGGAEGHRRPA